MVDTKNNDKDEDNSPKTPTDKNHLIKTPCNASQISVKSNDVIIYERC